MILSLFLRTFAATNINKGKYEAVFDRPHDADAHVGNSSGQHLGAY
jgi:hypothetical protein